MADSGGLHVVVFPWLAFGHMMPFLELSKALARRGHRVSFLSTPRNIARLPKLPSHLIDFVALPPPRVDGLPENAEATADLPPEKMDKLKEALDGLEAPFTDFIREASPKPDWIIHDFLQHWAPPAAAEIGVPCAAFSVFPAVALTFLGPPSQMCSNDGSFMAPEDLTVPPKWIPFPTKVAYRFYEAKVLSDAMKSSGSGVSDIYRIKLVIEGCKLIIPRSCRELEDDWLSLLQELYQKPVIPAGFLPPPKAAQERKTDGSLGSECSIMEWLNKQNPGSVVYVALGSEATLSIDQLQELALGLELSKIPFIWALRRPAGMPEGVDFLPEGFEERTKGTNSMVAMGWVPQVKVLGHSSVGCFLTHCGWGSTVEGIHFGHPLVPLPIFSDQGLNARVIEGKGIGVEIERNEKDGTFTREDVAKALRLVMVDEEGERYRSKAKELMEALTGKELHEKYVDDLIEHLRNHCKTGMD